MKLDLREYSHRRRNALTGEWVLVSPHRAKRPWLGQVDESEREALPAYDPTCYLCPGNERAGGKKNPDYQSTFVFDNDFPALTEGAPFQELNTGGVLVAESEAGICRVICFSPRHDLSLAMMEVTDVKSVVDVWARQSAELGSLPSVRYVQVFENRGALMGCSNPHPHCQVWASASVPNEPSKEADMVARYFKETGRCLLCHYLDLEAREGERVVLENDHFFVVVPFWAVWPFETLVCSRRHCSSLDELSAGERLGLAEILKKLTSCYDSLFQSPFPYSMGFHQEPTSGQRYPGWHLHAHFYPPLLRSARVRKFMVGYELLATPQRDISPESAAERLRSLAGV